MSGSSAKFPAAGYATHLVCLRGLCGQSRDNFIRPPSNNLPINVTLSTKLMEDQTMERLRSLIDGDELTIAPVALNPLMARMAVEAGFKAIYMSGGSLGWVKCNTEATITLPEMVDIAIDMRSVSDVPIVRRAPRSPNWTSGRIRAAGGLVRNERAYPSGPAVRTCRSDR